MHFKRFNALLALSATIYTLFNPTLSYSSEDYQSPLRFSGYGTIGYSYHTEDDLSLIRDLTQSIEQPESGSWKTDTVVGLQASYEVSPKLETVVQAVLQDHESDSLLSYLEWAFVSYRPLPDLNLRLGRVGTDFFMLSDSRNVGYAQTTLRPNREFYAYLSLFKLDGIDALYTITTPKGHWLFKAQWGHAKADLPLNGDIFELETNNIWDISIERQFGDLRLRAGFVDAKLENNFPGDIYALQDIGNLELPGISYEANYLLEQMTLEGRHIRYRFLGFHYDASAWLALGELSKVSSSSDAIIQGNAYYLTFGYRWSHYTPYIGASRFKPEKEHFSPQTDWSSLGDEAQSLQNIGYRLLNATRADQNTKMLGIRWDFREGFALKAQWDHIEIEPYGYILWDIFGARDKPRTVDLYSVSLDWVF
ncbi:MAG: hypothetical protein MI976_10125 [Pseudomonadales bacterium]|nr:hypothetical protein [Pseudomonadales bacterium]